VPPARSPVTVHAAATHRPPPPRRALARGLAVLALAPALLHALSGCSTPAGPSGNATPDWRAPPGQVLLLGEVHDNAAQHALRTRGLAALLAAGDRPALVMEQFDRGQQAAIDALHTPGRVPPDAAAIDATTDAIVALGGAGWHWPFYRPAVRLAVAHGLPLLAANVPRAEARQVIAQGLAATGWRADVPPDVQQAQADAVLASHCGQVDAPTAARLSVAQIARDQAMARLVAQQASRGVVLLAGNGHVQADIGVPRWLDADLRRRTRAVGLLEADASGAPPTPPGAFDRVLATPAQARPDPCAALRMPARPATTATPPAPADATAAATTR
jgi:uncharacterized iron-regulated protein